MALESVIKASQNFKLKIMRWFLFQQNLKFKKYEICKLWYLKNREILSTVIFFFWNFNYEWNAWNSNFNYINERIN